MGVGASASGRRWGEREAGALAVAGTVVAFSLSSTLVKRADSPGVLLAFWRMVIVAVVWNGYLLATGRRVTLADVRQVFVPGALVGLNLAIFFAGATHNSVANAALIGSLPPFVIVPVGAVMFAEHVDSRSVACALVAFAGVALVLLSAPSNGDATLQGNVFGFVAMLLWAGYVVSTRRTRRAMDVPTFFAAITPIAALAVLPLAIANGGMFALSVRGWTYTVILAVLIGIGGHGLMVFAQRTIAIGTIGIVQVIQPALAVVWSFLLLGEEVNGHQLTGIAIVVCGLAAFVVLNELSLRSRQAQLAALPTEDGPVEDPDPVVPLNPMLERHQRRPGRAR